MTQQKINLVHVYYTPKKQKHLVGKIALKEHKIYFQYDPDFLNFGLELSPFQLPLSPEITLSKDRTFEGLFGLFNDSLPDGWGRLLLDRSLAKKNIHSSSLSPLDRLCFVGQSGMGALSYEPEIETHSSTRHIDLDVIANEIKQFQLNEADDFIEDLLELGGSSAGARPKILVNIDDDEWLIKFKSSSDLNDIGAIEYAYHLMAEKAGLDLPEAKLFPSKAGAGFFGTKRFDKNKDSRIHMHTISGLLQADHRYPSLDYQDIIKATMHLTKNLTEHEKIFRQCAFNMYTHNRDDHSKNFSFLMDESGKWSTSPAYDLTFSSGPGGEHCSMIMGEGRHPTLNHLIKLAAVSGIKENRAQEIIDQVRDAASHWIEFAKTSGVNKTSMDLINQTLKKIDTPS